jgi:SAM-dependent methyltransferase
MLSFVPSLDSSVAAENLATILSPRIRPELFSSDISCLGSMFDAFTRACPPPWPAPGLALTPEIRYQSELWLPLALIRPPFERFCRSALNSPPLLSSTPFSTATSWAGIAAAFPFFSGWPVDPSTLLERLLADDGLRTEFLCWSFMPRRFYGAGSDRYPGQLEYIRHWLGQRRDRGGELRCLDAACGDGAATYGLVRLLLRQGWLSESFRVEGWTLEPLEVWSAAHARLPHDPARERTFRGAVLPLFEGGGRRSMIFRTMDLEAIPVSLEGFDLIICNGLLGGPVINHPRRMESIVGNLAALLRPQGLLLAADHFHGGWRKGIPRETIGELFRSCGLGVFWAGEGIGGMAPG